MGKRALLNGKEYQIKSGLLDEFKRGKLYLWADKNALYKTSCSYEKFNAFNNLDTYYDKLAVQLHVTKIVRLTGNRFQFNYLVALFSDVDNKVIIIKETSNNRYIQFYFNVDMEIFFQ